jgi:hypothetical protein
VISLACNVAAVGVATVLTAIATVVFDAAATAGVCHSANVPSLVSTWPAVPTPVPSLIARVVPAVNAIAVEEVIPTEEPVEITVTGPAPD